MNHQKEIVHSSKFGSEKNGYMICQIIKEQGSYVKQNIFPNGNIYEEDMDEEEYQQFLVNTARFDSLSASVGPDDDEETDIIPK